jgi:hypothetical protein
MLQRRPPPWAHCHYPRPTDPALKEITGKAGLFSSLLAVMILLMNEPGQ